MKTIWVLFSLMMITLCGWGMPPHSRIMDAIEARTVIMPDFALLDRGEPEIRASGSLRGVLLLADFTDQPRSVNATFFDELMNAQGLNFDQKYPGNLNVSSVREFYHHNSGGLLDLQFDVFGWFVLPQPYSYYVNNDYGLGNYPRNAQKLVEDLIEAADPFVDFSRYDMSGNGQVDFLMVVHTGPGAEFTGDRNDIWSHQWNLRTLVTKDGVRLFRYAMQPEYWEVPYDMTIGVYAHELGHLALGLPDLYDTRQGSPSYGIGYWGLMASGSWNDQTSDYPNNLSGYGGAPAELSSWSKIKAGWVDPIVIGPTTSQYLVTPGVILKYPHPQIPQEYFLIEWIADSPYNRYLPVYNRIAIWHIDDQKTSNTQPWIPGNDPSYHYLVALRQADGRWDLERKANRGDAGDLYGQGDMFVSFSNPSSHFYDGQPGVIVQGIEFRPDGVMLYFGERDVFFVIHSGPILGWSRIFVSNEEEVPLELSLSPNTPQEIQDAYDEPEFVRIRSGIFAFELPTQWLEYILLFGAPLR